jgi:hypothetical protein
VNFLKSIPRDGSRRVFVKRAEVASNVELSLDVDLLVAEN